MNAMQLKTAPRMRKNSGGYVYMICRVDVKKVRNDGLAVSRLSQRVGKRGKLMYKQGLELKYINVTVLFQPTAPYGNSAPFLGNFGFQFKPRPLSPRRISASLVFCSASPLPQRFGSAASLQRTAIFAFS